MTLWQSAENEAKKAANAAALDAVAKKKLRGEFDTHGNIEGSVNITTASRWTFTAYIKAIVKGPQKGIVGGGRIEKEL